MPQPMPDIEVVKEAVLPACRAPSVRHGRPRRRVPAGARAIIGCGAVPDHHRVPMVAAGRQAHIGRLPNPNNLDHVASVGFQRW